MVTRHLIDAFVKEALRIIPAKSDISLKQFITNLRPIAAGVPDADDIAKNSYRIGDWFFCLRKYEEHSLKQNFMEFWVGTNGAFWGYLRLNPYFYDDAGRNRKVWEITHAYAHTKYRGQGINRLYAQLALELARVNVADLLIANPRHVSMLVTLTDLGFKVHGEGGNLQSIKRIIKQGRTWYKKDVNARRLYYAQELRSFMTDGSLMMEKDLEHERFWKIF
jgi:GNAT superfamily N-acetyltransferase